MKNMSWLLPVFFIGSIASAQPKHSIKFLHMGDETHPVGTIIISVESVAPLNDRITDSIFGKSIKTNMRTFKIIEKFIKDKKYVTADSVAGKHWNYLEVWDSAGFGLDLFYPKNIDFFNDLFTEIKKKKADKAVIDVFPHTTEVKTHFPFLIYSPGRSAGESGRLPRPQA
jgi:hypothetical protein